MGYVKTITQIVKELGRLGRVGASEGSKALEEGLGTYDKAREVWQLLQGASKVPPQEFGRFNKFNFQALPEGIVGMYRPLSKSISIDTNQSHDYLVSFLHELEHSRQFNPNIYELGDMKALIANSNVTDYAQQPIEKMARRISTLAKPKPEMFQDIHNNVLYKSAEIRDAIVGGNNILEQIKTNTGRSFWGEDVTKDLEHIKPYSGKGWLFSTIPIFASPALQSGRENS